MRFLENMKERFTTKEYDNKAKIALYKIEQLEEILQLCPSSINSQPWKFFFVTDLEIKQKLAKASLFNEQNVIDCDTLVVFTRIDNISLFEKQLSEEMNEDFIQYYNQYIKTKSQNSIRHWFEKQVYLSLGIFISACADLKIDTTPMEAIKNFEYDSILELKDYHTIAAVAIGYENRRDRNQHCKKAKLRRNFHHIIERV